MTENLQKSDIQAATGLTGLELLQAAFIVLKLLHVINWSWWWVLAPTWIPIGLILIFLAIAFLVAVAHRD